VAEIVEDWRRSKCCWYRKGLTAEPNQVPQVDVQKARASTGQSCSCANRMAAGSSAIRYWLAGHDIHVVGVHLKNSGLSAANMLPPCLIYLICVTGSTQFEFLFFFFSIITNSMRLRMKPAVISSCVAMRRSKRDNVYTSYHSLASCVGASRDRACRAVCTHHGDNKAGDADRGALGHCCAMRIRPGTRHERQRYRLVGNEPDRISVRERGRHQS